jgi:hypothetical protein
MEIRGRTGRFMKIWDDVDGRTGRSSGDTEISEGGKRG